MQVNDDLLLELISKSTSEENDRLKRFGAVSKTQPVSVNAAQTDHIEQTDQAKQTDQIKQTKVDEKLTVPLFSN